MADFSLETILQFLISNGGRIDNRKLVTHFKDFLNHPVNKDANREKFKGYIGELAIVKVENGDKILVLKKNYRQASETKSSSTPASASAVKDSLSAHSEPSDVAGTNSEMDVDSPDGAMMSRARIDETMEVKMRRTDRVVMSSKTLEDSTSLSSVTDSTASLTSAGSQKSLASSTSGVSSMDEDSNTSVISVKDKIKNLNRNISDSDLNRVRPGGPTGGVKKIHKHTGGDDDTSDSCIALDAEQKDWLVVCSSSDYHDMNKLLSKNPGLAKLKDVTNGYTALHWAAKSGKSEVIKLLANKPGMKVDQRSHGGYTALHLAAMQGHQHVIELLVQTYKADANLRDFSGKKAKQYLKNYVSSKATPHVISMSESFARSSMRKSNRNKGVSSLMQAMTSSRQPLINLVALTEAMVDEKDGHQNPPESASSSPGSSTKNFPQDENLKPPPSDMMSRNRHSSAELRLPSQELSPSSRGRNDENVNMMKSESEPGLEKMSY